MELRQTNACILSSFSLKGKTVRTMPPVARQDVIKIPKEIWELHKDVTLAIDIFFVNKISFFTTYSLVICFL